MSRASAKPLAAHTPMRTPVKEPGPATQAISSTSPMESPAALSAWSTIGISVSEWVSPTSAVTE